MYNETNFSFQYTESNYFSLGSVFLSVSSYLNHSLSPSVYCSIPCIQYEIVEPTFSVLFVTISPASHYTVNIAFAISFRFSTPYNISPNFKLKASAVDGPCDVTIFPLTTTSSSDTAAPLSANFVRNAGAG